MKTLNSIEIENTLKIEKQIKIREVWIQVATSVAGANDCKSSETAISWANDITDAYVGRFGEDG